MKNIISGVLILLSLMSISCDNGQANKYLDIVYHFDKTSDSNFCNPDSLHDTDCELGYLYLTPKGNAIYHKYCFGTDTTIYCIGSYFITDSTISCSFDRDFVFAECTACDTVEQNKTNPNSGILKHESHEKLVLIKSNCNNKLAYHVLPTEEQKQNSIKQLELFKQFGGRVTLQRFMGFVFSSADINDAKGFREKIKKIPALSNL
jgi:hypothetical protein